MEVKHLKLITEVAKKGSLTKAMDSLYLSQSALSHQLKEIETELGATLFHRVNKKLVLTGAGKILLESAEKILKEIEDAELAVRKYASGDNGTLRVVMECYTCYHWLPAIMVEFNKEFPNVDIEIYPESINDALHHVLEGKIDLAVVSSDVNCEGIEVTNHPQLKAHDLFTDELYVLFPATHLWSKKKYIQPKDFEGENIIIHSYPIESVGLFRQLLIPEGIKPKKVFPIQITEAAVEMVKAGMGVRAMPLWMAKTYLKDHRIKGLPLTRKGVFRNWYAVTLNKPEIPQYLNNFIHSMRCNIAGICVSAD